MNMKTEKDYINEELSKFKEQVTEIIRQEFEETGELHPVLFGLIINEEKLAIVVLAGLGSLFVSESGKDAALKAMREFSKELKPVAIAFASEGWMSKYSIEQSKELLNEDGSYKDPAMRPELDPDRIEVLMINFETYDQDAYSYYEAIREVDGVRLKVFHERDWDNKGENKGRFSDILQENYSQLAELARKFLSNRHNLN